MSQDTIKLLKKSLHEIRRLKQKVNSHASRTPVAVVGMACRFPGGSDTPEKFWELLKNGHEGLCDVPDNRWDPAEYFDEEPGKPLKMYTQKLNFLAEDVSLFDSRLFTVSPEEAEEMDPRQRLLLELTWEALERSGHAPKDLKEQAVGVFMGVAASEYALLPRDMAATGPHTTTGLLNSMVSGCIAQSFGFHGPAISVDTACSSSMVSIHQACKSIQDDECHMAIAGGVGLMLSPLPMLDLCKRHALSKDGRCKTFSANGDGYGRGEGAGVVVLKRLDIAQRDGDPVLAVIEMSNLNHEGSASGLTEPNGKAQQKLLQETLDRAGIQPCDIGYVELHGIGTSPGDPVEFQSLAGVFGQDRSPDNPLVLGTCKANIGHLEAAAGIASVIKTVLCLQNRAVPPHINCDETNSRIQLQRIPAILPDSHTHWETHDDEIRRAGISSFGFSGTNAFIVIREAPEVALNIPDVDPARQKHILTISAQSRSALNELVGRYRDHVSGASVTALPSFAHTINVGRSHFNWRAACVWANREELLSGLLDIANDEQHAGKNTWYRSAPTDAEKRVSVIFPGKLNGVFDGLLPLIEFCPHFQETWKICEEAFSLYTSSPLTHLLTRQREHFLAIPLDEAAIIFSISCSMFDFFRYLGIRVSTVYAEGEGVFSMAASTGLVSLEQAIQGLVRGYMDEQAQESLAEEYQFCMPLFQVILPGSKEPLKRSGLSDSALLDCAYNEPGSREDIREMIGGDGVLVFEMDTRPQVVSEIYGGEVADCAASCLETVSWNSVVNFVAECYSHGHSIDWQRFDEGFKREKLVCPTYPFQRRPYWTDTSPGLLLHGRTASSRHVDTTPVNPLVGRVWSSPLKASQVLFTLGPDNLPTLSDTDYSVHIGHFLEMLMSGLASLGKKNNHIRFLTFDSALVIPEGEAKELHMMLEASSDSARGSATAIDRGTNFSFHTSGKHTDDWNQHVHGALGDVLLPDNVPDKQDFSLIRSRCLTKMSGEVFYQGMAERGFVSGTSVRWIDQVWRRDGEALARFRLATPDERLSLRGAGIPPGVWASCFQLVHATLEVATAPDTRFVLVGTGAIDFFPADISPVIWCHMTSLGQAGDDGVLDGAFTLYTDSGDIIAHCHGCEMKAQIVDKKEDAENASEDHSEIIDALKSETVPDHQLAMIVQYIRDIICDLLNVPADDVGVSKSINQPGMSSLVRVALRDKLNKNFDVSVPASVILQGPTLEELARDIQQQFNGSLHTETDTEKNGTTPDDNRVIIPAYLQVSLEKHKWVQGECTENAKINLYCLPYGGGGASLYRGWAKAFPKDVNVQPIQFPGREDRILEQPVESVHELLEMLTEVLGDDLNHPFAIYGHSAGALIAYAWARYLKKHNQPKPECLFVGGFTAPFIPSPYLGVIKSVFREGGFEGIPGVDEFVQQMQQGSEKIKECMTRIVEVTGIALHQDSAHQVFSDAILPQLVADCKLVESLDSQGAGCLNIPIAALHGVDDDRVSTMGMQAWKSLTTNAFFMETFPGDHFFLHADQSEKAVTRHIYDLLVTHNQEVLPEPG